MKTKFQLQCGLPGMFTFDPRGISLFRISLALLLLSDLAIRARDIEAHYTDRGILPLSVWEKVFSPIAPLCLFRFAPDTSAVAFLFVVGAVLYLLLLVGLSTRVVTVLSYLFLLSLQQRNPLLLTAGDSLLHLLLFWGAFVPLQGAWSFDRPRFRQPIETWGTAVLMLQVCYVYWSTAYWKSNGDWWSEGDALQSALSFEMYATGLGNFLLAYPELLRWMARLVLIFEWVGPFVVLLTSPWWRIRTAVVLLFIGMHASLAFLLTLGLFPYVSIIGWLPFIPAEAWTRFFGPLEERPSGGRKLGVVLPILLALSCILGLPAEDEKGNEHLGLEYKSIATLGLVQSWKMYARPSRDDGWFDLIGTDTDGVRWNLLRGAPGSVGGKPVEGPFLYPNHRWRKYMNRLRKSRDHEMARLYSQWLCRDAERFLPPGVRLRSVRIDFTVEFGLPPPALRRFNRPPSTELPLGDFVCEDS